MKGLIKNNSFILFIAYGFHPPWNEGSINVLRYMIDQLKNRKCVIMIISIKRFVNDARFINSYEKHPIYYISPSNPLKALLKLDVKFNMPLILLMNFYIAVKIAAYLLKIKIKPDYIVFSNVNQIFTGFLIRIFSLKFKSKIVVVHYRGSLSLWDKINPFVDIYVCTTRRGASLLRSVGKAAYYFLPDISFQEHDLDKVTARRLLNLPLEHHVISYIGNLTVKRLPPALFNILRNIENIIFLVVAPNTPLNQKYVLRVSDLLKDQTNIKLYIKNLTEKEKLLIFKASDFVILPYFDDGIDITEPPLVLLESLKCGCVPIVAPKYSMSEIVMDGVNGYIIKSLEDFRRIIKKKDLLK